MTGFGNGKNNLTKLTVTNLFIKGIKNNTPLVVQNSKVVASSDISIVTIPTPTIDDQVLTADTGAVEKVVWAYPKPRAWSFCYSHPAGTDYGPAINGTWSVRELDESSSLNPAGITLASDQITISINGKFKVTYHANFSNTGRTSMRLRNITFPAFVYADSVTAFSSGATGNNITSLGTLIEITDQPRTMQIEYFATNAGGSNALGQFGGDNTVDNIFASVEIMEVL